MEQIRPWSFFPPRRYAVIALAIVAFLQFSYFTGIGERFRMEGGSAVLDDCNENDRRSMSRVMRDEFVYSSLTEVPNSLSFGFYEALMCDIDMCFRGGKMLVKGRPACQLDSAIQFTKIIATVVGGLTGTMMWATYLGYAIFRKKPTPSFRIKCVLIGIILLPYLVGSALISILTA